MKLKHNCRDCRRKTMKKCKYYYHKSSIVEMAYGWNCCKLKPRYSDSCNNHKELEGHYDCVFDSEGVMECKKWEQKSLVFKLFNIIKYPALFGTTILVLSWLYPS